jgi:hypothetical protein
LYITSHAITNIPYSRDQKIIIMFLRTEVFAAVTANIAAFWDVTPCRLVEVY